MDRSESKEIYQHFSKLPGSQYMASEHAIKGLNYWLRKRKPDTVLEIGAGIGTLTLVSILSLDECYGQSGETRPYRLISLEGNDFCVAELHKNLADHLDAFQLVDDITALPEDTGAFDFVIVDGGRHDEPRYFAKLGRRATVFVEGSRDAQRLLLKAASGSRTLVCAYSRSLRRDSEGRWLNGYWIYQFEPSLTDRVLFSAIRFYGRAVGPVRRLKEATRL